MSRRKRGNNNNPKPLFGESNNGGGGLSWLDEDIDNKHLHNINDNFNNMNVNDNINNKEGENNNSKINELEEQLQHEKMTNKRLENEIEKLNLKLNYSQLPKDFTELSKYIPSIDFNKIEIKEQIGQGGFSEIKRGVYLNLEVAVKIIFDPKITQDLLDEFHNEINKLFYMRHPNIISLYGICKNSPKLSVCIELAKNGSLFDYLHKNFNKPMDDKFKFKIVKQLANTMYYIHENGFVHRDLKTQNMLLDSNFDLKLCDFGLVKTITDLNIGTSQFAGTPCYMAPEIFKRQAYDEKIDVYAFGTILWEIFMRKVPWMGCDANEIKNKALHGEQLPISNRNIPKNISDLITKCRQIEPSNRPSFKEISQMLM